MHDELENNVVVKFVNYWKSTLHNIISLLMNLLVNLSSEITVCSDLVRADPRYLEGLGEMVEWGPYIFFNTPSNPLRPQLPILEPTACDLKISIISQQASWRSGAEPLYFTIKQQY